MSNLYFSNKYGAYNSHLFLNRNFNVSFLPIRLLTVESSMRYHFCPSDTMNVGTSMKYHFHPRGYWLLDPQGGILVVQVTMWMLELQWNILASHKVIDYWILNDVSLSRKWQYECFKFNEVSLLTTTLLIVGSSMRYPCCPSGNMNAGILMKHPYRPQGY